MCVLVVSLLPTHLIQLMQGPHYTNSAQFWHSFVVIQISSTKPEYESQERRKGLLVWMCLKNRNFVFSESVQQLLQQAQGKH